MVPPVKLPNWKVPVSEHSMAVPQSSESPWLAWGSPTENRAPGTATGDFSLLVSAMPALDASTDGTGDKDGYAAFGKVVSGMEIVKKIHAGPTSPTKGEGFLKGQMLEPVVRILTVREWKPTPMKQPSTP